MVKIVAKINKIIEDPNSKLLAYASVSLGDGLTIRGLKVIDGSNGRFVSMPSSTYTNKDGIKKRFNYIHVENDDLKSIVEKAVIKEYEMALDEEHTNALPF